MAPNNKNRAFQMTSDKQTPQIQSLSQYFCRQCKKWKLAAHYSNKELKDFQIKKAQNSHIDGVSAKLRCRGCAGQQIHELQCEGPCGRYKPLDQFSKSQRTRGGSKWCQECVLWKEAAEPGVITAAPPNSEQAPDEHERERVRCGAQGDGGFANQYYWNEGYEGGDANSDDEDDYFASDDGFDTPYQQQQFSTLSLTDKAGTNSASAIASSYSNVHTPHQLIGGGSAASGALNGYIPPHMRSLASSTDASMQGHSGYVPPHLRGTNSTGQSSSNSARNTDLASQSSASNPYETDSTIAGSVYGWSAIDARRRNGLPNQPSNPSGQQPVPPTLTRSQSKTTQAESTQGRARNNSNWARAVGRRGPPPQFPVVRTVQAQNAYDSDESQDEM